MRYQIHPPAEIEPESSVQRITQLLTVLHGANPRRQGITLELSSCQDGIGLFAELPLELKATFVEVLQDAFPGVRLTKASAAPQRDLKSQLMTLTPDIEFLRGAEESQSTQSNFNRAINALLSQLRTGGAEFASMKIRLAPVSRWRRRMAQRYAQWLNRHFPLESLERWHRFLCTRRSWVSCSISTMLRLASKKTHAPLKEYPKLTHHLFDASLQLIASGGQANSKLIEMSGALQRFTDDELRWSVAKEANPCQIRRRHQFLLSSCEAAMLWHPPPKQSTVARMKRAPARQWEPPQELAAGVASDCTMLGRVQFRGSTRRFGIRHHDLMRHLFVCGRTGSGKSTLIRTMALDDIEKGRSLVVIDPHGDLVDSIAQNIPRIRTNDVVYLRVGDRQRPVSFNPLFCGDPAQRPLVADNVLSALKRLYGDSWGPRLEQILRNACLAVLETNRPTLLSVQQMLTLRDHRQSIVSQIANPVVRSFWVDTFAKWNDRFRTEAVSPVLNKLDAFLANPVARHIVGDPQKPLGIRERLDEPHSILLCDLSKGLIGEQTSNLIGSLLVSSIQTAALARAGIPEEHRSPVHVYIDEFHAFTSDGNNSFATILSESRKYKVAFAALATQYLDQIDDSTIAAVLGNAGSSVVFRAGARDAGILAKHLGGVTPDQIVNLPNFTAYAKLLIDQEPTREPFSMKTIPGKHRGDRGEIVERVSRIRWGSPAT